MSLQGVDLMPASRRMRAARRTRITRWSIALSVWTFAMATIVVSGFTARHLDLGPLREELEESGRRVALRTDAMRDRSQRLQSLQSTVGLHREIGDQPDWRLLLHLLARIRGERIVLDAIDLQEVVVAAGASGDSDGQTGRTFRVVLAGRGVDLREVTNFVVRLEASPVLRDVTLSSTSREASAGGDRTRFRIECRVHTSMGDRP